MDIYQKLSINPNNSAEDRAHALESKKQNILRKLNAVFGNFKKERELQNLLDEIEAELNKVTISPKNMHSETKSSYLSDLENSKELSMDSVVIDISDRTDEQEHITDFVPMEKLYDYGLAEYKQANYEKAANYFKQAADLGHKMSQYFIGGLYELGKGTVQDQCKAAYYFEKAAEQGFAYAQYQIGMRYYNGNGVEENYEKAFNWLLKSANQGCIDATYKLAQCYEEGHGTAQDYEKAFKWYKKVAECDEKDDDCVLNAKWDVGRCYLIGIGVSKNENEAIKWIREAAEHNIADAQFMLGSLYHDKEKNMNEAIKWYEKSALLKDYYYPYAQYFIGQIYFNQKKFSKALICFKNAAERGHEEAKKVIEEYYS